MAGQAEYAAKVYRDALAMGIPEPQARLAAAQSALETGYGKSAPGNAYFGIKAGPSWNGATQTLRTHEEVNGQMVPTSATFRAYDTASDSLGDWWNKLQERWPNAASASTFPDAVAGLNAGRQGGYATDSKYGSKLGYINDNFIPAAVSAINSQFPPTTQRAPGPSFASPGMMAPPQQPGGGFLGNVFSFLGDKGNQALSALDTAKTAVMQAPGNIRLPDERVMKGMAATLGPKIMASLPARTAVINGLIRGAVESGRNHVAATDPKRGQTIMTNNHGAQTVGTRLNNSRSGYTVTGDDWFNSVRGL